jgi:hypothetical protein
LFVVFGRVRHAAPALRVVVPEGFELFRQLAHPIVRSIKLGHRFTLLFGRPSGAEKTIDSFAAERQCAVRDEPYPCDAINLLEALEEVEAAARTQFQKIADLKRRNAELEDKIRRAIEDLS